MDADDIRGFFEALSAGDVDPFVSRLADDCVLAFPGSTFGGEHAGARKIRVFLKQNQRLFDGGLRFTVHHAHVAGDRAVVQWTNAGTTKTGKAYANRGVTVFTLADDRIVRIDDYLDTETVAETWPR